MKREPNTNQGGGSISRIKLKTGRLTGALLLGSTAFLCAGTNLADPIEAAPIPGVKTFCDAYRGIGKLYKNEDNPVIQDFSLFGRMHWQYGILDGSDAFGRQIDYDTLEFRRFRLGTKARVFDHFGVKVQAELSNDTNPRGGDVRDVRFQQMWDMYVTFDAHQAFGLEGLDILTFGYGARETHTSYEWDTSSNKLKTVERSAISNKVWPANGEFANATGAWIKFGKDAWKTEVGIYTTTQGEFWAPWEDGQMYWFNHFHDFTEYTGADVSRLFLTGFYQNSTSTDPFESLGGGIEWNASAAFTYGRGPWQFTIEGILGKNSEEATNVDRRGHYWGVVFLPSMWVIEDKLELVGRYQYQGSENPEGIRLNSRYARRADDTFDDVSLLGGRGDQHHAYYLGFKYHFCKNNIHAIAGIEYDDINRGGRDIYDGWSYLFTVRMFL